ncbi:MAG TPA: GNVR domain-containing protein [Gemmatimonadaceae bacterium]
MTRLLSGGYDGQASADTIEVADIVRTLKNQWRAVIGFLMLGVVGAAAVVLFAPRRFEGKATLLARSGNTSGSSIVSRITGLGELMGGLGAGTLGSGIETELQVLRSRVLAGQVVDSLRLQFRVREPEGTPAVALIDRASLAPSFAAHKYQFDRQANGQYRTSRDGKTYDLVPGQPGALDVGTVTLRSEKLPSSFEITIMDREDAITRLGTRLEATKAGGDVAKIVYRGDDSLSAALGANALMTFYLERRKTTDRGTNQRRVEYVTAQVDSTAEQLARTERDLRRQQEASKVLDAAIVGKVELESAAQLRRSLTDVQVDEGAIKQLLAQADAGRITSRDLAAYPVFLRGSSVSPLVGQLSDLEGQRIRLLERRTERDPEVVALDQSMRAIEASILATARSYASSVSRQREQMQARLDSIQKRIFALPAAAERGGRMERDVERLTKIFTALQAQLVEARLAAIGEGGDVRPVDLAVPSREPSFPKPLLTMGIGTAGGLLAGIVAALFLGWFGRWLRDPLEIERAVGVVAQRLEPDAPLVMAGAAGARTVLVVPLDSRARAGPVAERLARTAKQRELQATVIDLSARANGNGAGNGVEPTGLRLIEELERKNGVVIVHLPGLTSEATVAAMSESRPVLLVAPPGPVDRAQLASAVDMLRRLQVPCAGVVIDGVDRPRALL